VKQVAVGAGFGTLEPNIRTLNDMVGKTRMFVGFSASISVFLLSVFRRDSRFSKKGLVEAFFY
jgi:hypothetical protein